MSIIRLYEAPNILVDVIVLPLITTFMKQIGKKEYFGGYILPRYYFNDSRPNQRPVSFVVMVFKLLHNFFGLIITNQKKNPGVYCEHGEICSS